MGRVGLLLLELMALLKCGLLLQQFLRILFLLVTAFWLVHGRHWRLHRRYVQWRFWLGLMVVISAIHCRRFLLVPGSDRREEVKSHVIITNSCCNSRIMASLAGE
uniref:(northern house mosquito) hypothetical protein n=1 Tax=Culex pipiens TaxID=7175 RepID=A0A8D8B951_CULPI